MWQTDHLIILLMDYGYGGYVQPGQVYGAPGAVGYNTGAYQQTACSPCCTPECLALCGCAACCLACCRWPCLWFVYHIK